MLSNSFKVLLLLNDVFSIAPLDSKRGPTQEIREFEVPASEPLCHRKYCSSLSVHAKRHSPFLSSDFHFRLAIHSVFLKERFLHGLQFIQLIQQCSIQAASPISQIGECQNLQAKENCNINGKVLTLAQSAF